MLDKLILYSWCSAALLLGSAATALAQRSDPDWTKPEIRQSRFPTAEYLMGFSSGKNLANEAEDQFLEKHLSSAITELSSSIYVNLTSSSKYDLTIENTATNEQFRKVSQTSSRANIANLQTEKYYNPSTKNAFAIAWVKKTDLLTYNRSLLATKTQLMQQNIQDAEQWKNNDKKLALKAYYECLRSAQQLEDAENVLIALNSGERFTHQQQSNTLKAQALAGISALQSNRQLSLGESVNFMSQGLALLLAGRNEELSIDRFTYQNTAQESDFSVRLKSSFEQNLSSQNIRIAKLGKQSPLVLSGTFWEQGTELKIYAIIRERNGETVAAVEGNVPVTWLKESGIGVVPPLVVKLRYLENLKIVPENAQYSAKITELGRKPLKVKVFADEKPVEGLPLQFILMPDKTSIGQAKSNANGIAEGNLSMLKASPQARLILVRANLAAWLGIDTLSTEYQQIKAKYTLPDARVFASIKGSSIYIQAEELELGRPMSFAPISSAIKKELTAQGFTFTGQIDQADYQIRVQSDSKPGPSGTIVFAYVDANVTIMDMATGNEMLQLPYKNVKDGGANIQQATNKIYQNLAIEISKKVLEKMSVK